MTTRTGGGQPRGLLVAAAVVVLAVAAVVLFLLFRDDGNDVDSGGPDTTTSSSTTTTADIGPAGTISDEEAVNVVWPGPDGELRYDDAMAAVRGFSEELVGFTDPVYGDYQGGDSRSGEVEVRAGEAGPVTTVFVRKLSDDSWWVLGAATEDIVLDSPLPGSAIDDPLLLSGQASAFEGTVQVSVFERGDLAPLGEGFVTGSGSGEPGPFEGEVRWENPRGGWGVVLLYTASAEDNRVVQATAIPVGFIGGD
jgi:hypothetical protein